MQTFTSSFFTRNRKQLRELIGSDVPIVLAAHTQVQCTADMAFPFRQDTNFWYLTGCDDPDMLFISADGQETLVLPKNNAIRDVFDGTIDIAAIKKRSGITRIISHEEGKKLLKKIVTSSSAIASLPPMTALQTHYGISPNPARRQLVSKLRRWKSGLEIKDIRLEFAQLRTVKSDEELAAIKDSIKITVGAFKEVKQHLHQARYAYELEAVMTKYFRERNAKHAYTPIIAGGKDACILHYAENQSLLEEGKCVLLDVGAEASRGAADISRTYVVGEAPKLLKQVHQAVLAVQQYAFSLLKPGLLMQDFEKAIEKQMGVVLMQLGVISEPTHEQIRERFPHATSHYLGLDVHDIGDYSKPLVAGSVLTVEPGIYLPEHNIGVRIEDNVLITETGYENLSAALPTAL